MIDINDYKIIYKKNIISITRMWIIIIFFIIIGIIFLNKSFKYKVYYNNIGEYKDDYISIYVLIDDIKQLTKNKEIIINDEKFAYNIKEISEENIYMNSNYYKELKLEINKKLINNEIVKIRIVTEEKSLLEYVFETVWR